LRDVWRCGGVTDDERNGVTGDGVERCLRDLERDAHPPTKLRNDNMI
jgi:hypothetical protein